MMAGERGARGRRRSLLLLLLAACSVDCGSGAGRDADTSAETDVGPDGEVAPDADGAPDGDGDAPTDAEDDAPRADGDADAIVDEHAAEIDADIDVPDLADAPEGDAGATIGTPCTGDAACSGAGLTCNESWGICVASSCAGRTDFTPCELIVTPSDRAYDICVAGGCVSPGCGDASCNAPGPNWPLPDTDQRFCCNGLDGIPCPGTPGTDGCAATADCGQDAQYGWDVTHAATERFGRTAGDEPVVTDNVSGLDWQGCPVGQTGAACDGTGSRYTWQDALAYCDSLSWGGFADWGLPDRYELESIIDYGGVRPAIDSAAFPATPTGYFWSSSSSAESSSDAWRAYFDPQGYLDCWPKTYRLFVRCIRRVVGVRDGGERFTRTTPVTDQPVVADAVTALVWQGCTAGLTGSGCGGYLGYDSYYSWEGALAYCEGLDWGGYTDWYLPSIRELASIADDHRFRPGIDPTAFPATPADEAYWSSSSVAGGCGGYRTCDCKWGSYSGLGDVHNLLEPGARIRCGRRGP